MTKKILFIVTQSEFGGAQHFLAHLIDGLRRDTQIDLASQDTQKHADIQRKSAYSRGQNQRVSANHYEIVVGAGPEGDDETGLLRFLEKKGINTRHLKYLGRAINPLFDLLGLIEIRKLIKKEKPDTLFLCSSKAGALGSLAVKLFEVRSSKFIKVKERNLEPRTFKPPAVIYRIGGWAFNDPRSFWSRAFYKTIEKISARWKDIIIVNAECHRKQAIELGIKPRQKIVTVYNGIGNLEFLSREKARAFLNLKDFDFVVGTIANDYPSKGLKYLKKAAKEFSNIKFVIIGTGNRFIPDAYKYLKAFDIFVLPSVKEGFPWTILEAMAAEVPIVATKVGAIPEIIKHRKTGLLIKPASTKELSEAISELINNKSLGAKLLNQAKRVVEEKFTLEKMVNQIEKLL